MPVVNCNKEPYEVYIGQDSNTWKNKYFMAGGGILAEIAQDRYRSYLTKWLDNFPEAQMEITKMHQKVLGCNCEDLTVCHGHVILELAEKYYAKYFGSEEDTPSVPVFPFNG